MRDKNTSTSVKSGTSVTSAEEDDEYDIDGVEVDIGGYGNAAPPAIVLRAYQHDDDDIDGVPLELSKVQQTPSFGGAVDDGSMMYDDDVDGIPL